jgi:hypothetical protein
VTHLFSNGEFQPSVAEMLTDAELADAMEILIADHDEATNAHRAGGPKPRRSAQRLFALRSWVRAREEAAGTRTPVPTVEAGASINQEG